MGQVRRVMIELFPRGMYRGDGNPSMYYPREREKIAKLGGGASAAVIHARLYARSTNAVANWSIVQGSFGTQMPAEQPRLFTLSPTSVAPSLPWNAVNMANLPDDGTLTVAPTMGLVDFQLQITGGANTWVELEVWATLDFDT